MNCMFLLKIAIVVFFLHSCNHDSYEHYHNIGDGYYLDYGGKDELDLELHFPDSIRRVISGNIIGFRYNESYVVLCRKPTYIIDSLLRERLECNKAIPNEILNYTDYYIVDKKNTFEYGPFQKKEYLIKMQELNIPDSLRVDK